MGFQEVKDRQRSIWGSAPWEHVAEALSDLHDDLIERLRPQRGERWLDLATGTGAVAVRASRAGANVTALDLAPPLIETARRLAAEEGLSIRFEVGDCESLPYGNASFDVVSSAVGVIFAPDHHAVAAELGRVCRSGGRLGLVTWRPNPEYAALLEPYRAPSEPGAGDPDDWGREEHVLDLLGDSFEVDFTEGEHQLRGASGEAVWQLFTTSHGAFRALVKSLASDQQAELHRAYVEYLERYRADDGIRAPDDYLVVLGRRR